MTLWLMSALVVLKPISPGASGGSKASPVIIIGVAAAILIVGTAMLIGFEKKALGGS